MKIYIRVRFCSLSNDSIVNSMKKDPTSYFLSPLWKSGKGSLCKAGNKTSILKKALVMEHGAYAQCCGRRRGAGC